MNKSILILISGLFASQIFAAQSPAISAYCNDRNLYWVNASTTLKELRDLGKVKKLSINNYVQQKDCAYAEEILNYQIARTEGKFVIGAEQKFYLVSPQNTVEDIATGKVLLLDPRYTYSANDSVEVPTKINIPGFLKSAVHALATKDLDTYSKIRKQKQLEAHFNNAPKE